MTIPVVRFVFGGREAQAAGSGRPWTVVYDGQCKVCGRLVKLLDKWDSRDEIETIPFQNTSVLSRFPWIPAEAYAEAMQLVGPGGQTWQGGYAIEQLLKILPFGGLLGWAFRLPFFGALFNRFYRWFARNRYKFGCGEHCAMRPARLDFRDQEAA
ncbi:MAG: thiol-disulfide oxidoreductase DCC family protein [Longimicrobiaceae bacterium]